MKCHEKEVSWLLHNYTLAQNRGSADIPTFFQLQLAHHNILQHIYL